jgi:hypothetical protein
MSASRRCAAQVEASLPRAACDPNRKSARAMLHLAVFACAPLTLVAGFGCSFGGSDASRVDTSTRRDIVDLAARGANVH